MRQALEVQTGPGLVQSLRHNYQGVELTRREGKVIVTVWRSWMRRQRQQRVVRLAKRLGQAAVLMLSLSVLSWAAQTPEVRTAYAVGTRTDGCTETQALVQLEVRQSPLGVTPEYPDGWVRTATVEVQQSDTCLGGVQTLNVAGQVEPQPMEIAVRCKLQSAAYTGWVGVWDGVSRSGGNVYVRATFTGVGQIDRSVWRTIQRQATADITIDGFGLVGLRLHVDGGVLRIVK